MSVACLKKLSTTFQSTALYYILTIDVKVTYFFVSFSAFGIFNFFFILAILYVVHHIVGFVLFFFFWSSPEDMFIDFFFWEGESEKEREKKKHWCERETLVGCPRKLPDWGSNPQSFCVRDDAPTNWATWPGPHCVFICISLMAVNVAHLFICLFIICISSLVKCLYVSFAHVLIILFAFFTSEF